MKLKKILLSVLGILTFLFVMVLCVVLFWLGPAVKSLAGYLVPKALGTPVAIEQLSINPRTGSMELSGFVLRNQDGFGRTNAVSLAGLEMSLDIGSLFGSTVVVHRVLIDSPQLTYEQSQASDNIMSFLRDFEEFANIDLNQKIAEAKAKQEAGDAVKAVPVVLVESLQITNTVFHLANAADPLLDMDVVIGNLQASMTNGVASISDVRITNPKRLRTPHLFTLDEIKVSLLPETLYADKVAIKTVQILRPHLFLELNDATDTLAELLKIGDCFARRLAADPPPELLVETVQEALVVPEDGLPVELQHLVVEDYRVHVADYAGDEQHLVLFGIDKVEVELEAGAVHISDVAIANPSGFSVPHLFTLDAIHVQFDPDTLLAKQVQVPEVHILSPEVNLEEQGDAGNVAELQALMMQFSDSVTSATNSAISIPEPSAEPINPSELPVAIKTAFVSNMVVNLVLNEEDQEKTDADVDGRLAVIRYDLLTAEPLEGRVNITDLQVANPVGFSNPHLVTIEEFSVDVDMDTLTNETLYVEEIAIRRPRIAYERQIRTDNIQALQHEIMRKVQAREEHVEAAQETKTAKRSPAKGQQKVAIGHFVFSKGLVKLKLSLLPSAPIPLPTIELNNIGDRNEGADLEDALTEIGTTVYSAILGSVSSTTGYATAAVNNAALVGDVVRIATPQIIAEGGNAAQARPAPEEQKTSPKKRPRTGGRRRVF